MRYQRLLGSCNFFLPIFLSQISLQKKKQEYENGVGNEKSDLWSCGAVLLEFLGFLKEVTEMKKKLKIEKEKETSKSMWHTKVEEWLNEFQKWLEMFIEERKVSEECKDLLRMLLRKDPKDRIEWEDFFEHPFVQPEAKKEKTDTEKALEILTNAKRGVAVGDVAKLFSLKGRVEDSLVLFHLSIVLIRTSISQIEEFMDNNFVLDSLPLENGFFLHLFFSPNSSFSQKAWIYLKERSEIFKEEAISIASLLERGECVLRSSQHILLEFALQLGILASEKSFNEIEKARKILDDAILLLEAILLIQDTQQIEMKNCAQRFLVIFKARRETVIQLAKIPN